MNRRSEILTVFFLLLISFFTAFCAARQIDATPSTGLDVRVSHFELSNQTLSDGIAKLTLEPLPLAFGFEEILRPKFSGPPVLDPHFALELNGSTVREILNALCEHDGRYMWSLNGSTVNVYPRETLHSPRYLLNLTINKLEIKNAERPEDALKPLADAVGPTQQIAYARIGGDSSYSQPWTMTLENVTVRQAVNRLAAHMGSRSSWIFYGAEDFRAFGFFKAGFYPSDAK